MRREEPALDLRLVPAAAAAWLAAAWAVAAGPVSVTSLACAGAAGSLLALAGARTAARRPARTAAHTAARTAARTAAVAHAAQVVVVLAVVSATCLSVLAGQAVREAGVLPRLAADAATVHLRGVVTAGPRRLRPDPSMPWTATSPRWALTLAARRVSGRSMASAVHADVLVIGGSGWRDVQRGTPLAVTGRLRDAAPGSDVRAVLSASGPPRASGAPSAAARALIAVREDLTRACAALTPDARALLPGLVVGDTRGLPPDLDDAMRTSGLTHLTAVSGGNTSLVTGAVLAALSALGVRRSTRLLAGGCALGVFVALAGGEASVARAGVMAVLGLVAVAFSRRSGGVPALAATVVALLLADPWLARSAGFALSVAATGALLVLVPAWSQRMVRWLPRPLALALTVPFAAQVVCAPVIALLAARVSLVAVPANALADPVVAPTTVIGLLATAAAPVWPWLGAALARVAGVGAWWIALVARRCAALPGAWIAWPQGWPGALLLGAATIAAAAALAAAPSLGRWVRSRRAA